MKKIISSIFAISLFLTSCNTPYDDSYIKSEIQNLRTEVQNTSTKVEAAKQTVSITTDNECIYFWDINGNILYFESLDGTYCGHFVGNPSTIPFCQISQPESKYCPVRSIYFCKDYFQYNTTSDISIRVCLKHWEAFNVKSSYIGEPYDNYDVCDWGKIFNYSENNFYQKRLDSLPYDKTEHEKFCYFFPYSKAITLTEYIANRIGIEK